MGILIAITVILLWLGHLLYLLFFVEPDFSSPVFYLHILIQGYLYTGLFITAHDSMHGAVSGNRRLNNFIGHLSTTLFAFLPYNVLKKSHYMHHRYPATEKDPDFSVKSNNFFLWWFSFMKNYTRWWQIFLMAVTFNLLLLRFTEVKLIAFWVVPAFLGTFQLFFFGTWMPHKRPITDDMKPHNARTQKKNHLLAMLSCYFFGYHREHHESPRTPWWKLYKLKD
jgi:beta-carotene/zeaxanthin 4-ketolase